MKIGILLKDLNALENWELRIIEEIMNTPNLALGLLVLDGRTSTVYGVEKSLRYKPKKGISKLLFKIQWSIERKIILKETFTADRKTIFEQLKKIPSINVDPIRKDSFDIFNENDSETIKKYHLDVIVAFGFPHIKGDVLNSAKNGIWSLRHSADHIHKESPTGFWEITGKEHCVIVSLNQLAQGPNENTLIDKTYFNRHWSLVKTSDLVLESSVALLLKNLKRLEQGSFRSSQLSHRPTPTLKSPNLLQIMKYCFLFYRQLFQKIVERITTKFFGVRYNCFTLFMGHGSFLNTDQSFLKPIKLPKNEFWADPFLYEFENNVYVFFENYSYTTERGKISCGKIENGEIINVIDVLDLNYHLSYPFIFSEKGEIYMMPESCENRRLEIYRCLEFPSQWELHATGFDGELVVDAFFYDDESNQKWLFLNKASAATVPMENELHIYKVNSSGFLDNLVPHHQNPVIIDARKARNGGAIFRYKNEIYRPSQCNDRGLYGRALNINKIKKLSLEEYVEETVETIQPDFYKGLLATHHLHQIEGLFVIDAAYKKL